MVRIASQDDRPWFKVHRTSPARSAMPHAVGCCGPSSTSACLAFGSYERDNGPVRCRSCCKVLSAFRFLLWLRSVEPISPGAEVIALFERFQSLLVFLCIVRRVPLQTLLRTRKSTTSPCKWTLIHNGEVIQHKAEPQERAKVGKKRVWVPGGVLRRPERNLSSALPVYYSVRYQ